MGEKTPGDRLCNVRDNNTTCEAFVVLCDEGCASDTLCNCRVLKALAHAQTPTTPASTASTPVTTAPFEENPTTEIHIDGFELTPSTETTEVGYESTTPSTEVYVSSGYGESTPST